MNTSMKTIRLWLAKNGEPLFVCAVFLFGVGLGAIIIESQPAQAQSSINLARESAIANVAVQNSTAVAFENPLDRGNFIQITLNAGDAQIFTYCPPQGGACVDIPSGGGYEIGPLRREMPYGQPLGTVQTATDGATLQIVAQRVQ